MIGHYICKRRYNQISCDYCKLSDHNKDKCYKLHGYPMAHRLAQGKRHAACVQKDELGDKGVQIDPKGTGMSAVQLQNLLKYLWKHQDPTDSPTSSSQSNLAGIFRSLSLTLLLQLG